MTLWLPRIPATFLSIVLFSAIAIGGETGGSLVVQYPKDFGVVAAEIDGAASPIVGKISPGSVLFVGLDSSVRYDVKLTCGDGRILQGVDMGWYNADPADPNAGDMDDDDRQQISAILKLPSFFNHSDLVFLKGNHDRAVALVQLVRDQPFDGDGGQGVIWRVELWYLKNEHGGWVKESNKVLRRERFGNPIQFHKAEGEITWVAE